MDRQRPELHVCLQVVSRPAPIRHLKSSILENAQRVLGRDSASKVMMVPMNCTMPTRQTAPSQSARLGAHRDLVEGSALGHAHGDDGRTRRQMIT